MRNKLAELKMCIKIVSLGKNLTNTSQKFQGNLHFSQSWEGYSQIKQNDLPSAFPTILYNLRSEIGLNSVVT